jgi:hypothetical protein
MTAPLLWSVSSLLTKEGFLTVAADLIAALAFLLLLAFLYV